MRTNALVGPRILVVLAVFLAAVAVSVQTAPPAEALHQHCGDGLPGTGSLSNGHPDRDDADRAWGGVGRVQTLEDASRAIGVTRTILGNALGVVDKFGDLLKELRDGAADNVVTLVGPALTAGTPASQVYAGTVYIPFQVSKAAIKTVGVVLSAGDLVLIITEFGVDAALIDFNRRVGNADACGGTLSGDTLHMTWVALVQRQLAMDGPPLAMMMAPQLSTSRDFPLLPANNKTDFSWCPAIPAAVTGGLALAPNAPPLDFSTAGNCVSTVQQGFLDVPDVGVKDVTRSTIDHLDTHGVDVRDARTLLSSADTAYNTGDYRAAFFLYRDAYQRATEVVTS